MTRHQMIFHPQTPNQTWQSDRWLAGPEGLVCRPSNFAQSHNPSTIASRERPPKSRGGRYAMVSTRSPIHTSRPTLNQLECIPELPSRSACVISQFSAGGNGPNVFQRVYTHSGARKPLSSAGWLRQPPRSTVPGIRSPWLAIISAPPPTPTPDVTPSATACALSLTPSARD